MKKIIALIIAGAMFFQTGCSFIFPNFNNSNIQSNDSNYIEFNKGWCYQRLPPVLKSGYRETYNAIMDAYGQDNTILITENDNAEREHLGLRVELSQPLQSREQAKLLYTALLWDNPQLFYIGNTYSYEGYRTGDNDYYNVFFLVFTMNAGERADASRRLEDTITAIVGLLDDSKDQFETQLMLHNALLELCIYETRANDTDDPATLYPNAFTAYGALVEGRAVCEGYARAMQLLLHRVDMECTLVTGTDHNQMAHMWNMVTVDGRNYHVDPTWNLSNDRIHHSYFNLTTQEILKSHTIDEDNIGIDTCTSFQANYYYRKERQLDTVRRDEIARVIAHAIIQGETIIGLRFTKNTYPGARLFINNSTLLRQMVNSYLEPHDLTMYDYNEYNANDVYYTLTIYK